MGWIQKLRKKAKQDTPEGLQAEIESVKVGIQQDSIAIMEKGKRRLLGIMTRLNALRQRHGLEVGADYEEVEADLDRAIHKVKQSFV
jgi:hypothetical protein